MKLIAIRPLEGCNPNYLKLLTAGKTYFFCNNFAIDENDAITEAKILPVDFFSNGALQISVEAVVGKNGSGKSTLIELLFRAINNIAYEFQKTRIADLIKIKDLRVEFFYLTDTFYKVKIIDNEITFFKYDKKSKKINLALNRFSLKDFFYSIVVNYSHYAYNVNELDEDDWIDGLFHKNDGYRTPLVLNPLRTNGNIDINSENHLVKSRLISNLLHQSADKHFRQLTPKLLAKYLKLTINKSKRGTVLYRKVTNSEVTPKDNFGIVSTEQDVTLNDLKINKHLLLKRLDGYYKFSYNKLDKEKYEVATDYLLYKMVSIALKYYNYEGPFFSKEKGQFDESMLDLFLEKLYNDTSHITIKLRQTVNFLKYGHIDFKDQEISLDALSKVNADLIEKHRRYGLENIELIPPPIFDTQILMVSEYDNIKKIAFKFLSSGEKQMIYSVSSILYHIINLDSVPSSRGKRIAYRYINVILEEIEMYAHPEMQRTYLKYILDSIKNLPLKRTKGINLCFLTHSPFILSDLPECNVLFLNEDGSPEPITQSLKTFGGNIHDLLAHSFFLKEGAIGAFALEKIEAVIKQLSDDTQDKKLINDDELLLYINLIGEVFLRNKLLDMYYSKFNKQKRIEELEAQLKKLKNND
ncbi:ATP-binding cassette domain-containing protein [Chitinophaga polysaccharea]|uniref:ATP-binding cassette domain-containing protein n=1 Tax=Chitinophaga polysaccharea TaxID=1293035 RepID=UPI001455C21B|nr:ATP-binding cassette domain-containing protein [Chitinophaga polysaccharea]NLR57638.1 ATP-binding cassette domain-containing protein [Chitinophaga polysaccharea]